MNAIVLGLGFGDEGKGHVVNWLASRMEAPAVVRFSGGHQAGHTVVIGDKRHVFANFGSGTLQGAPTFWSRFCTVHPPAILRELDALNLGRTLPKLFIDEKCPVTTPYDIYASRHQGYFARNGTCGVGFGATIQREADMFSLLFEDLAYERVFRKKLQLIKEHYEYVYGPDCFRATVSGGGATIAADLLPGIELYVADCLQVVKLFGNPDDIPEVKSTIYEGSQGLMLDQNFGFFPHVTRANTGTRNALELNGGEGFDEVYLVTRAYQTRHGNGPMTRDEDAHHIASDPRETNQEHQFQGTFRKAVLDVELLDYAITKDPYLTRNREKCKLVVTCLDHLRDSEGNTIPKSMEDDFIAGIGTRLGIGSIYTSHGPDMADIKAFAW